MGVKRKNDDENIYEEGNVLHASVEKNDFLNIENSPEFKIYDAEIEKKKRELLITKKQNLPQFSFSTNYYLYGSDQSSFKDSWEDFGQRVRGIYISYSTCDNEVFHRAMRDVLAGATREALPDDLIAGNYGLKVQAENVASEEIELLKDMKERYGVNVMRRFLNSFNVCQTYAVCMVTEDRKKVKKQFDELVETLVNISSF